MQIKQQIKIIVLSEAEEVKVLGLKKLFEKQKSLFLLDPWHRSLNFEKLEPKENNIWSIRVNKKYRALLVKVDKSTYQIYQVLDYHK